VRCQIYHLVGRVGRLISGILKRLDLPTHGLSSVTSCTAAPGTGRDPVHEPEIARSQRVVVCPAAHPGILMPALSRPLLRHRPAQVSIFAPHGGWVYAPRAWVLVARAEHSRISDPAGHGHQGGDRRVRPPRADPRAGAVGCVLFPARLGTAEVYELDRPAAGGLGGVSDRPGFVSAASRPPGTSRIRLRSAFHRAIATTWREGLAPPSIPRVSRPTSASVAHHRR
jgi:hypothetical protein